MSWFSEWFNSPYYHILYKDRDVSEGRSFIDSLDKKLHFRPEHKILDLACGKGRHSVYLNSKGLDVTGVDLAPESIDFANQFGNERLRFAVRDMREPVSVSEFDFVLNLFTSFGYFKNDDDNTKTICSIATSLKPNGIFVLDFFNSKKVVRQLIDHEEKEIEGINFHISKRLENGFIMKSINFDDKHQHFSFYERVKALYLNDFEKYISEAGLKILSVFGDYNLREFDKINSDRLIIIAQKPM
jgi:SAM-dependent methyltransferase